MYHAGLTEASMAASSCVGVCQDSQHLPLSSLLAPTCSSSSKALLQSFYEGTGSTPSAVCTNQLSLASGRNNLNQRGSAISRAAELPPMLLTALQSVLQSLVRPEPGCRLLASSKLVRQPP